jgi:thiamine kinase-like enzyme
LEGLSFNTFGLGDTSPNYAVTLSDEKFNATQLAQVPPERLLAWLGEFYGKDVQIAKREVLRESDLSFVERLWIADSLPQSVIHKLVLPPWDIEQDLHQRVLIPSISSSAQLYMSAHHERVTALFLEDLGSDTLAKTASTELASEIGEQLARMHRSYSYRVDELMQTGVLRTVLPLDYATLCDELVEQLLEWKSISGAQGEQLKKLSDILALKLAREPASLVHGDLFAENIILHSGRLFIIDWSWFTILGVPLVDLAMLTMEHQKNGGFSAFRQQVIESYSFESAREIADILELLPYVETLSRLLFLHWLAERRKRGILGPTIDREGTLISQAVAGLCQRLSSIGR